MLKARKEKTNFLQYGVLEIWGGLCLTSCSNSASSKPWVKEEELEVSSMAAYERVKVVAWLGEADE